MESRENMPVLIGFVRELIPEILGIEWDSGWLIIFWKIRVSERFRELRVASVLGSLSQNRLPAGILHV